LTSKEEISNINLKDFIENETGKKFDRNNKICCPLPQHGEKTPSFAIKKYNDKYRFYCYGCGCHGDIIDFVKEYKSMNYIEACNYINIEPNEEYGKLMTLVEKVEESINKINFKDSNDKPLKYIHTYIFVDQYNKPIYFEAKFKDSSNKSTSRFLSVDKDNKITPSRGVDAVPYNYYKLLEALKNKKDIFIVEGAKDADTLNYMGYTTTSFKGVTKFDYNIFKDARIYIIPDTGAPGENYKDNLYYKFKDHAKEFNVIYPEGLSDLGSNKDITDYFQSGKTLADFKISLRDKWDYKKSRLWRDADVKNIKDEKIIIPKKTWRNVEQILKRENVNLKYNLINKEAEAVGRLSSTGDELIIDIQTLCISYSFNINKDVVCDAILKISRKNQYNPFIDYLKTNRNGNHKLIEDMFNCLILNDEGNNRDVYLKYFTKWLMDLVTISQNTIEKGLKSQGVLVLQGIQGGRKSTFFQKLISNNKWFKGESSVDTKNKDSVMQNTVYVLVELSEFDGMAKGEQSTLKRFFTNEIDVYRAPYGRCTEKHPRITTFCATVNPKDFLKDRTGSRRFWVIPVTKCDTEILKRININMFWGAVYDLWLSGEVSNYLNEDETESLMKSNTQFNIETNISIAMDENFDFNQNPMAWKVYSVTELLKILDIRESKALKNEFERCRYRYGTHRDNYSDNPKKGYKLPNVNIKEVQRLARDMSFNPFEDDKPLENDNDELEEIHQEILI
jgi:predicted P-loop ATPase